MVNPADNHPESRRRKILIHAVFFLFIGILLYNHAFVYLNANTVIDSDQPFMWMGLKDYAEGHFYEPRFYGQDYNTFLECLVAVPFYQLGLPVYQALPLATHLLLLVPLLFTAIVLFTKGKKLNAIAVLAVFLCMTTAFDIMSSLPRGFVTGVFFSTFFILSVLHPEHLGYLTLNLLMLCAGIFVNPNVIVTAAPMLALVFLRQMRQFRFYACVAGCGLFAIPLYFMLDRFYDRHPGYVILNLVHSYSPAYFLENIRNLDQCFTHVSFFVEENCLPLLSVMVLIGTILAVQNRTFFLSFLLFIFFLLLSFFAGKTREGSHWPFYSYSRMYIGLPFALCLFVSMIRFRSDTVLVLIIACTLVFSGYKIGKMKDVISYHTFHLHAKGVRIVPLVTVLDGIRAYGNGCREHKAGRLVISSIFWMSTYLNYGGPAVDPDFPETEESSVDRRYWVREGKKQQVVERFMLLSINYHLDEIWAQRFPFRIKKLDDWGFYLVEENQLSNGDFLVLLRNAER